MDTSTRLIRTTPGPGAWLLQQRDPYGLIRRWLSAHATAPAALAELVAVRDAAPALYDLGGRALVVIAPTGAVIAHTGADIWRFLPEQSGAVPSLPSVGINHPARCAGSVLVPTERRIDHV